MKAVNFLSKIFCSGVNMSSRIAFDGFVEKYSNLTAKEIDELICKRMQEDQYSMETCLEASCDHSIAFVDSGGKMWGPDKHEVSVDSSPSWYDVKNGERRYYLLVNWYIIDQNPIYRFRQKTKKIVYKVETIKKQK